MNMERIVTLWMQQAERDAALSQTAAGGGFFDGATRHLQDALEKYVKALFLKRKQKEPPRTHALIDIGLKLGAPTGVVEALREVSKDYIAARYPDMEGHAPFLEFDEQKFLEIKALADKAIQWVTEEMGKP